MSIDYIEFVCPSNQCGVILRDYTPFVNPTSRLITGNAKPKYCACGAPAIEREKRDDGSMRELLPDGVIKYISADGDVKFVGKIEPLNLL